jgi:hypothetical protein
MGQMLNDLLAKAPMLKVAPVKLEPLKGEVKATYDLNAGILSLPSLTAKDVDNSELQLKGKAVLAQMQGDFVGTFYWARPTVKGCVLEGNSDKQGRLMVPVAIKGNLLSPGFSLLNELATKLAEKALKCEMKKQVEKVQRDGKEKVEKEIKNRLKELFGK